MPTQQPGCGICLSTGPWSCSSPHHPGQNEEAAGGGGTSNAPSEDPESLELYTKAELPEALWGVWEKIARTYTLLKGDTLNIRQRFKV